MPQLTAADMKPHMVIDASFTDDDALITGYIEAAEVQLAEYLRRDLDTEFPAGWPAPLKHALKFIVAHMYSRRGFEAVADEPNVIDLVKPWIAPYRDLS